MVKNELRETLEYHDNLYYNNDEPEISDAEYDLLKRTYVEQFGEYDYVPGQASSDFEKYEHTTNVSSLDKVQIIEQDKLRNHIERLWPVVIEPKMDGLTVVKYEDGTCVTRGNGSIGEIINNNMSKVDGVGQTCTVLPIRMEVVMLKSEFNRINSERFLAGEEPLKNTRNAAAGMLRKKIDPKVSGLRAYAYNFIYDEESEENARPSVQNMYLKQEFGWNTVTSYEPETIEEAMDYINNFNREELDYDIDGLVIKHNGDKLFGETVHHPLNAIAVKFEAEGEWTKLEFISTQVGRTGKIVPIANFVPVDILGSTIRTATLHNFGIVKALGLNKLGAKYEVKVEKANDVIPAIVDVRILNPNDALTDLDMTITECPECKGAVKQINDQYYCINEGCSAKILNRLTHLSQRDAFDIEGLSEETAKKLIDSYRNLLETSYTQMMNAQEVNTGEDSCIYAEEMKWIEKELKTMHPSFIYKLNYNDILGMPGFAEKSATNLFNEINKSLNIPFDRFLYGCGMPLIGRRASKSIAEFYYKEGSKEINEFVADYNNNFEKLRTLKGFGPEMIKSLIDHYHYILPFGEFAFTYEDVMPKKKATNQLSICITGVFNMARKDIKSLIENSGHKMASSVTSKTNYLIAAPGEESTVKYKKAQELDIEILNSIDELKELL